MDTLAIAERSFYRALLSLRTSADMTAGMQSLLPPLLRATSSRGAHLEVAIGGVTLSERLGVVSPELLAVAVASGADARACGVMASAMDPASPDAYAFASIGERGHVYLQRPAKRPLTYRHRENIELLVSELEQLVAPSPASGADEADMYESTRRFQTKLATAALDRAGGNVTRAARAPGVRRGLIYELVGAKPRRRRSS